MKTRIKLLLFTLALSSVSFGQIKIKTPDLEKKAKEKLEKSKDKKEKDVKEKKEEKIEEVEKDKKPSTTTASEKVEENKAAKELAEKYKNFPNVSEATLLFSKDQYYAEPLSEIVAGESVVYAHIVLPKNAKEYFSKDLGFKNKWLYIPVEFSFIDSKKGEIVKINEYMLSRGSFEPGNQGSSCQHDYNTSYAKEFDNRVISFPLFDNNATAFSNKFVEYVQNIKNDNDWKQALAIGNNNINFSIKLTDAEIGRDPSENIKLITGSFKMIVKEENIAKIGKYGPYAKDFKKGEDNGIMGDVHKQNVGKMVFSSTMLNAGSSDVTVLKNKFKLSDDIFSSICLQESFLNMTADIGGRISIRDYADFRGFITINGKEYINNPFTLSFECNKTTFLRFALIDHKNVTESQGEAAQKALAYIISQLPGGSYDITINVRLEKKTWEKFATGRPMSIGEGKINLTFTTAERDEFVKKYGQKFDSPNGGFVTTNDAAIIALAKKALPNQIAYKVGEMTIKKNIYGVTTHREGRMYTIGKDKEGDYVVYSCWLKQENINGKWDNKMILTQQDPYFYNIPIQNHK